MIASDVTVLTCTGGRPEAFALCEKYMARQTAEGFDWIVVDDCEEPTACTMGQRVIRREPYWTPGSRNTLALNLIAGLEAVEREGPVVIVEDDDWYSPEWVGYAASKIRRGDYPLVGEGWTIYYHVGFRCIRRNQNNQHASLCATAFHSIIIPSVIKVARECRGTYIDIALFRSLHNMARVLDSDNVIGIKGLPGRPGTTKAHATMETRYEAHDLNLLRLEHWIGKDAELYKDFYSRAPVVGSLRARPSEHLKVEKPSPREERSRSLREQRLFRRRMQGGR